MLCCVAATRRHIPGNLNRQQIILSDYFVSLSLSLFERKALRLIFGAKRENGTWRKRYNYELYEIFNESNIVNYIKVKRLAWAGHLVLMNSDRIKFYSYQRMHLFLSYTKIT